MGRISVLMNGAVLGAILGAAASLCGVWPAAAQPTATQPRSNCFRMSQLQSTRPDGDQRVYLRVNVNEYYRIDLQNRCYSLPIQGNFLVLTPTPGQDLICNPLDLDLKVSEHGALESCFIKSITRLTPEEAAAIPKKSKP